MRGWGLVVLVAVGCSSEERAAENKPVTLPVVQPREGCERPPVTAFMPVGEYWYCATERPWCGRRPIKNTSTKNVSHAWCFTYRDESGNGAYACSKSRRWCEKGTDGRSGRSRVAASNRATEVSDCCLSP